MLNAINVHNICLFNYDKLTLTADNSSLKRVQLFIAKCTFLYLIEGIRLFYDIKVGFSYFLFL